MSTEIIIFIAETVTTFGAILIALTALRVHHRVWKQHKINKAVFGEMQRERLRGHIGIGCFVFGYVVKSYVLFFIM